MGLTYPINLEVSDIELKALEILAERGGTLPGWILAKLGFDSPTACQKAMNHLQKIGLVHKGKYRCYNPEWTSTHFYGLTGESLGLICGGEDINPSWLAAAWAIRFNLLSQEARFMAEMHGWEWVSKEKEILSLLRKKGIFWPKLNQNWPLFLIKGNESEFKALWILWKGLTLQELPDWERCTKELRQKELLIPISLTSNTAQAIQKRLYSRGIRGQIKHLGNFVG
jgi:hypothetical protein